MARGHDFEVFNTEAGQPFPQRMDDQCRVKPQVSAACLLSKRIAALRLLAITRLWLVGAPCTALRVRFKLMCTLQVADTDFRSGW